MSDQPIHIVGAGLAGSEAAWQAAEAGVQVVLHEMRPQKMTEAHVTGGFAELVCSNSFRSDDHEHNAVDLLHEELRRCGSLVMRTADAHKLPAGGAHDERACASHLLVQQADRVVGGIVGAEGVGADQLGQAVGEMRIGAAHRAHLVQHHRHAGRRDLPRGLGAC